MDKIEHRLTQIIKNKQKNDAVGVLYSGGLDSTIIAKILSTYQPLSSINIVCVGFQDSHDVQNALYGAKNLNFQLNIHYLTLDQIMTAIRELKELNIINNPIHLTVAIPLFFGIRLISKKLHVNTIFLGQGADELFGGYKRYSLLFREGKIEEIKKRMKVDLKSLMKEQIKMERGLAEHFGVNLIYPYLDSEIIQYAQFYPVTSHITYTIQGEIIRKTLLRELAKKLGIPDSIVTQQKKAMQYGSGTVKALRKLVKKQGYANIKVWFESQFL